jgi:ubiquinone/menaquinone biosynthesis C-methylase UbiE
MRRYRFLWILIAIAGGVLFFWLFPLKLLAWLAARFGHSTPCPASLGWLVNNSIRRRYTRPALERVGIRPGERVLELGPGPGLFTVDAARRVGSNGRLVAVDIQPEMIARVRRRVEEAGLTNVETHVASAYDLPLEDGSVDRAFLITVLPEIPDQARALIELRRVLKPGGVLSITEDFMDPDYPLPRTTTRWAETAGFQPAERHGNWWLYTLNFQRPAA